VLNGGSEGVWAQGGNWRDELRGAREYRFGPRRVGGFDSRGIRWYCEADGLAKEREPAGVNSEVDCYFL
jgi:hypothetical protein